MIFQTLKRSPVPKRRTKPRKGPARNEKYKAFIRSLPCCVCRAIGVRRITGLVTASIEELSRYPMQQSPTEAAHTGVRGLGQKSNDHESIPLCCEHHTQNRDSYHRLGKNFFLHHGIDRDALIATLNRKYTEVVCKGEQNHGCS